MSVLPTTLASPASRRQPGQPLPRWADLKRIGDAQRLVLFTFVVGLLAIPLSGALDAGLGAGAEDGDELVVGGLVALVIFLGVRIWMAVGVYRLTSAMGSRVGVLWALGAFLPNLIGLVVLIVVSSRATSRLKKAGLKVGLMGAKLPAEPPPGFLCEEVAGAFS